MGANGLPKPISHRKTRVPSAKIALEIAVKPHSRPNWAQIDLDALRFNAQQIARAAASARLICVVKANAYGHGALPIARVLAELSEVAMLAVASVDEAQTLREGGIETPILLLSALLPGEADAVVEADLTPTVWTIELASALDCAAKKRGARRKIHFKVDSGMNRLGANLGEAARDFSAIMGLENLEIEAVYTHFACADEEFEGEDFTALQLRRFNDFCAEVSLPEHVLRHAANTAGALRFPEARFDLVRPGIALYGAHPCRELAPQLEIRPVMTWQTRITALKNVAEGEGVSYGGVWVAPRMSRIATLAAGYADGYLRCLSNRGHVLINGKLAKIVGRVTMDQILVDVTEIEAQIGDIATLWGRGLPVESVAARAETISYELLCGVAARVPRRYAAEE